MENTPLNTSFLSEMTNESKDQVRMSKSVTSRYVNHVTFPTSAFSSTGSEYLPVLKASKGSLKNKVPVIRLRVLTQTGGITVTIISSSELIYKRYRALLDWMNNNQMQVSFPSISINYGAGGKGLYFMASDFKMKLPTDPPEPVIKI